MRNAFNSIYVIAVCLLFTTNLITEGCIFSSDIVSKSLPKKVDFNYHVKPILSDRCFKCHGPDENVREASLRFDTKEGAFALLDSLSNNHAIVAGDLKRSKLVERISSTDPGFMMPPPESNLSLSQYEIDILKRWIQQGAEWKPHWSFIPPTQPEIPSTKNSEWPNNQIDHFILTRLENEGLKPESTESREKWLRRVSFDLTGLPAKLNDIDAFLSDESPNAYENVVDRLLSNPAYGERMASIWLDASRYADSHGYQDDRPRTMWPWRDWVVNAFNDNMPYDTFVSWQLAGDLLPNATYDQKLATGFNRNHAITQEGGVVQEEYITEYIADRTNTTSTAFLGLTMECARCHDHKYDPISQKDYYSMFAFFNGIDERGQINYFNEAPKPNMKVEDGELQAIVEFINANIAQLEEKKEKLTLSVNQAFNQWVSEGNYRLDVKDLLEKGMISYHSLDQFENFQTVDRVNSSHPAKANTGLLNELQPPLLIVGFKGNALVFDGSNFLNIGDVGDFDWYDSFSLGAWVRKPAILDKDAGILVKRNGEQKRGGYELAITRDGYLQMSLIHDDRVAKIEIRSKSKVANNLWSHIFVTYDGSGRASGLQLFIDGILQNTVVSNDALNRKSILNGNDLLAGNWTPRNKIRKEIHGFAGGQMDEIRVYERELSPIEVLTLAEKKFTFLHTVSNKQLRTKVLLPHYLQHFSKAYRDLQNELLQNRRNVQTVPNVMIMEEMDTLRKTFVLARGAYDAKTEQVWPSTPSSILPFSDSLPRNRLGLAQWITDPQNPLTARVMVNRLWQVMFGKGLVQTPEDFGNQGALPSHPNLLDFLAIEFIDSGWDIKSVLKKIALSATYRQSSEISSRKLKIDPENTLLARGPSQRLSAEMIRDNALAVSGLLHDSIGGKWVKPYQPKGIWKELANQIGENKYRIGIGTELYRRSLYTYWKRTIPPPTMLTFDASERAVCSVKRQSTTTPLQSLVLLNDPQYIETSRVLAKNMIKASDGFEKKGIQYGFRTVTSRLPQDSELEILIDLLKSQKDIFSKDPEKAKLYVGNEDQDNSDAMATSELAAWSHLANTLLNLDEAKMKS